MATAIASALSDINDFKMDDGSNRVEQVELNLDQDGRDIWGFGIAGNRTMGVYIKTIHHGSPADKCGKLRIGDQLLAVDKIDLASFTSEQVARIIRQIQRNKGSVLLTISHTYGPNHVNMCRPRSAFGVNTLRSSASDMSINKISTTAEINQEPQSHSTGAGNPGEVEDSDEDIQKTKPSQFPKGSLMIRSLTDDSLGVKLETHKAEGLPPRPPTRSTKQKRLDGPENHTFLSPVSDNSPGSDVSWVQSPDENQNIRHRISAKNKHIKQAFRVEDVPSSSSDADTIVAEDEPEDRFKPLGLTASHTSTLRNVFNRSTRIGEPEPPTDELPLVSFDQLSQSSSHSSERGGSRNSGLSLDSSDTSASTPTDFPVGATPEYSQRSSSNGSQRISWHCPVCLDGASRIRRSKRRLMSTVCGHVFCDRCLRNIILKSKLCPTCRSKVQQSDIHPIFM